MLSRRLLSCGNKGNLIAADSLLHAVMMADSATTQLSYRFGGLPVETLIYEGNTTFNTQMSVGYQGDDSCATILKVKGNLTISQFVSLTTAMRRLALIVYVEGNLNIAGEITMSLRGACGAQGQELFLVNKGNTDYRIEADGGWGADSVSLFGAGGTKHGLVGGTSWYGAGGGGGSGGVRSSTAGFSASGKGGRATSFSGGAGGGGCGRFGNGIDGAANGGAGGAGVVVGDGAWPCAGGGAGNPGGGSIGGTNPSYGTNGTGGTLIVFSTGSVNITASGGIRSVGGAGGNSTSGGGGGSGGGAIAVFHKTGFTNQGELTAAGGLGGSYASSYGGGNGGDGSIQLVQL